MMLLSLVFILSWTITSEGICRDDEYDEFSLHSQKYRGTIWDFGYMDIKPSWNPQTIGDYRTLYLSDLVKLFGLHDWFKCFSFCSPFRPDYCFFFRKITLPGYNTKRKCIVVLLLILSGSVHPNPGPEPNNLNTPEEFKIRAGLGFIHINAINMVFKVFSPNLIL